MVYEHWRGELNRNGGYHDGYMDAQREAAAAAGRKFSRVLTLHDDGSTREKHTVMDKFEVMTDDARNPDFEGLEDFIEFGKTYRITVEEVCDDR